MPERLWPLTPFFRHLLPDLLPDIHVWSKQGGLADSVFDLRLHSTKSIKKISPMIVPLARANTMFSLC